MAPPRPSKKDVTLSLLEKSGVYVHMDPRVRGVVVPEAFLRQTELVLQFGLNMAVPIRDLVVDDECISGTLSFSRRPFWVRIPWDAVFAVVSDEDRRGGVWPEDAPRESQLARGPGKAAPAAPKRPALRVVGKDERASEPPPDAPEGEDDSPSEEGECIACGKPWVDDASTCVVCGVAREISFRAAGSAAAREDDEEEAGDDDAPRDAAASAASEGAQAADSGASAAEKPAPSEPPPDGDGPKPKRPSFLRLVK